MILPPLWLVVQLLLLGHPIINGHQTDEDDSCLDNEGRSRYSEENNRWSLYLEKIKEAREANRTQCGITESGCSDCYDQVIRQDLAPFKHGISKKMIDESMEVTRVVKYQIIGGKLYRSHDCLFPFRCRGVEHFLLELAAQLPDMEFVLNTRDWPQVGKHFQGTLPIFSFSKTPDYLDIMYPAWTFWEGGPAISIYPTGLGRWDQHVRSLTAAAEKTPWQQKSEKAFFRGSRTSGERDPLVLLSRRCPSLADAQYTRNQAWKSDKDTLGLPPAQEVTLESHCAYKYLFNYRGVAASFRFKHLFLCNSLVFHVGEDWVEFFYSGLVPWLHYIPVSSRATESELRSLLEFARHHDSTVEEVAAAGASFIRQQLGFPQISCYWRSLLEQYSRLLSYTVHRDPTLLLIQ